MPVLSHSVSEKVLKVALLTRHERKPLALTDGFSFSQLYVVPLSHGTPLRSHQATGYVCS